MLAIWFSDVAHGSHNYTSSATAEGTVRCATLVNSCYVSQGVEVRKV